MILKKSKLNYLKSEVTSQMANLFWTRTGKKFWTNIEELIRIKNMAILPGSEIILDNNPLSISSFLEEYGDVV